MSGLIDYNTGVPSTNNNPSLDQPLMLENTDNIAAYVAVDHGAFGANNSGYHRIIHFLNQLADPARTPGFGQLYTKTVSADQLLFYESELGIISQLTGPNAPSALSNGYVWIGPVLLQWGVAAVVAEPNNTTVFFPLAFPTASFSVVLTPYRNSTNVDTVYMISQTTDRFICKNTSSGITQINWIALGN